MLRILIQKQQDYGPLNISLAPGGPLNGLRVRMYDKLARLSNLVDTGDTPNYESLEDTLLDLANYAIIGVLVQRGQWEGVPEQHVRKHIDPVRSTDTIPGSQSSEHYDGSYQGHKARPIVVRG